MSPARRKKQRAEDRDQGLTNNGGSGLEPALTKRKNDLAHWKQRKLLGVVPKIDFGTLSETPETTARADRRRMEHAVKTTTQRR